MFSERAHLKTVLRINSPLLVEALQQTINASRSSSYKKLFARRFSIIEPYVLLFQNRKRLIEAAEKFEGEKGDHVKLLLAFLKTDRPTTWERLDQLEQGKCEQISFEDVWLLYPPGMPIYRKDDGQWRAYKTEKVRTQYLPQMDSLHIDGFYLDFDNEGLKLRGVAETLQVLPFSGNRSITDLEVIPETHFKINDSLSSYLETRGRRFWAFSGKAAYQQYSGTAWPTTLATVSLLLISFSTTNFAMVVLGPG